MKPRILLASKINVQYYVDAVNNLGGIADAKYLPEIDLSYDGLLLCGGSDSHPQYYGQEINGAVDIDEARDEAEVKLCKAFVEAGKPILGICRGFQLINIVFGGNMIQHLPNADRHTSGTETDLVHGAVAKEGSLLYRLYGKEFSVNSHHHQALDKVADGFDITVMSDDGVIEAIEHKSLPIFGVQWHPERMCFNAKREDTVDGSKVIEEFIKMCRKG